MARAVAEQRVRINPYPVTAATLLGHPSIISGYPVDNTPAFVPFLLMFALIAILIGGLWRQDRDSGLWRNEYIDRPDGAASRPFSEIRELAKMAGVLIVLVLAGLGFHLLISS